VAAQLSVPPPALVAKAHVRRRRSPAAGSAGGGDPGDRVALGHLQAGDHIPCGGLRGPLQKRSRFYPELLVRWQSCYDEDTPEKWDNEDVSRQFELCIVCFRATAGGPSRWSWLACEECRAINESLGQRWGFRPFALGRHSIMNGIAVRGGSSPEDAFARLLGD
jgi:hypothetical protein